jgi:carbon-monoxide dehydrogenase large subunit
VDALRPLGVTDVRMPASPWRVWDTIQAAAGTPVGDAATGQQPSEPAHPADGPDQEVAP